jgi:hypothetical protein
MSHYNKILLKRTNLVGFDPLPDELDYGELAINYQDGLLFYKTANNNIGVLNPKIINGDGISLVDSTVSVDNTVVRTTSSYADPSWFTSLNYSKLTGDVPVWNQNTTGTANNVTGVVAIANGGTNATTAQEARNNLLPSQITNNGKYLTTDGSNVSWASVDALPNQSGNNGKYLTTDGSTASWATLTVGTIASQNANNVSITGGSITGITDLAIADGGTGASTAENARTNLGLGTIATQNANNVSITGGSINNTTIGSTTPSTGNFTTLTLASGSNSSPSLNFVGDSNTGLFSPAADTVSVSAAGVEKMTISSSGVGIGVSNPTNPLEVSGINGSLLTVSEVVTGDLFTVIDEESAPVLTVSDTRVGDLLIIHDLNSNTDVFKVSSNGETIIGNTNVSSKLEIFGINGNLLTVDDTITGELLKVVDSDENTVFSVEDNGDVTIIGGSITGITDLAIADGGTGASTAANARTNLDVYSKQEAINHSIVTSFLLGGM